MMLLLPYDSDRDEPQEMEVVDAISGRKRRKAVFADDDVDPEAASDNEDEFSEEEAASDSDGDSGDDVDGDSAQDSGMCFVFLVRTGH